MSDISTSEIGQTWKKLERDSASVGYKEGISAAKDNNFQKSFDEGFKHGLENGFKIGGVKGILTARQLQNNEKKLNEPLLEGSKKAWCVTCPSSDAFLDKTISKIARLQGKKMQDNLGLLEDLYKWR